MDNGEEKTGRSEEKLFRTVGTIGSDRAVSVEYSAYDSSF